MQNSGRWYVDALLDELLDKGLTIKNGQPLNVNNEYDLEVLLSIADELILNDDFIKSFALICDIGSHYATEVFIGMTDKHIVDFYDFAEVASKLNKRAKVLAGLEILNIVNLCHTKTLTPEFCYYLSKYYVAVFWWLYLLNRVDIHSCDCNLKNTFYNR